MSDSLLIHRTAERRARAGAEPLLSFLKSSLGKPVSINMNSVDRLDSFRLRILLSAHREWEQKGVPFYIEDMSDSFQQGLSRLGVDPNQFAKKES